MYIVCARMRAHICVLIFLLGTLVMPSRLDTSGKEALDVLEDGSVDVVYNNYNAPGNADKAMRKLKPGGFYISIAGAISKSPKPGVTQQQFLVNATRPRDLVCCTGMLALS